MSQSTIDKIDEVPVEDTLRKPTDRICCILALLYVIGLAVYSYIVANKSNLYLMSHPTDGDGKLCGVDYPSYKYLFFADYAVPNKRVCVSECPNYSSSRLQCQPTIEVGCVLPISPTAITRTDTQPVSTPLGNYCFPQDPKIKSQMLRSTGLVGMAGAFYSTNFIAVCCLATIIVGLLYMLITQCIPQTVNYMAIVMGSLGCALLCVVLYRQPMWLFYDNPNIKLIVIGAIAALGMLILIVTMRFANYFRINGIFLNHANRFVNKHPSVMLHIITGYVMAWAVIALCIAELLCVWSQQHPRFNRNKIFYTPASNSTMWIVTSLIIIQLWVGLAFTKQFFNFLVSGNSINWFYHLSSNHCQPFNRLLRFHLGSVVVSAFMMAFFTVGDVIFDFFRPRFTTGCYGCCFDSLCGWLNSLFELVRSDAMAQINLTGLPYCTAARYCEYLCRQSHLQHSNQSVSRYYRLGAHVFLGSVVAIFAILYSNGNLSLIEYGVIFGLGMVLSTYFISLHADIAEALIITYLTEEYLKKNIIDVKGAPDLLVSDLMTVQPVGF